MLMVLSKWNFESSGKVMQLPLVNRARNGTALRIVSMFDIKYAFQDYFYLIAW